MSPSEGAVSAPKERKIAASDSLAAAVSRGGGTSAASLAKGQGVVLKKQGGDQFDIDGPHAQEAQQLQVIVTLAAHDGCPAHCWRPWGYCVCVCCFGT